MSKIAFHEVDGVLMAHVHADPNTVVVRRATDEEKAALAPPKPKRTRRAKDAEADD